MKKSNQVILTILTLILSLSTIIASEKDVSDQVNQYLNAVKMRESVKLDDFVNDDASFTMVNKIVNKKELLNESDYLKMVKSGQVGAWVTNSEIKLVDLHNDMAIAYVESEGKKLVRQEYITLVLNNNNWEIVNSVSTLTKK